MHIQLTLHTHAHTHTLYPLQDSETLPMPVSPKPFLAQVYEEVIVAKVPAGTFKDADEFFNKLRYGKS